MCRLIKWLAGYDKRPPIPILQATTTPQAKVPSVECLRFHKSCNEELESLKKHVINLEKKIRHLETALKARKSWGLIPQSGWKYCDRTLSRRNIIISSTALTTTIVLLNLFGNSTPALTALSATFISGGYLYSAVTLKNIARNNLPHHD